jgi:transposase-like protein
MNIISIYKLFPTDESCITHLEQVRWQGKPTCPYCGSTSATPVPSESRYHCNGCKTAFSVTVRTIFHHTHLPIQKWFLALSLILNAKKGLSARQLSRDLEVNKNTAWRMAMKIRDAMNERHQRELLTGIVEADETYVGGKPRKGNPDDTHHKRGRGTSKTPVVGLIQHGGKVKAKVALNGGLTAKRLSSLVRQNVDIKNSTLVTDELKGYLGIHRFMAHQTIDHQVWYVNGNIHTNNIESFWAILKRGIVGQFHKVTNRYLPKYLDEFCYRYNYRENPELFAETIKRGLGV